MAQPDHNRLNNLFPTNESQDELRIYLQTGQIPESAATAWRYRKRVEGFSIDGDQIKYGDLTLVRPEDHVEVLGELFHNDNNLGIGKGIVAFYKLVASKYIGITRLMCKTYLNEQFMHQTTRPMTHRNSKPILAKFPNQSWGVDLIDCNHFLPSNVGWRYIVTVIDIFSRKIWLGKLKKKEAENTTEAFRNIIQRSGVSPNMLICDNGTEFQGPFSEFCRENEIKIRRTIAHNPQSNGITERANLEIRKIMRAIMLKNNNHVWHNKLMDVERNKNNSFSGVLKSTPDTIWEPTKEHLPGANLPDHMVEHDPQLKAQRAILDKAKKSMRKYKAKEYAEGDLVRVKMSTIFASVRAKIKAGLTKNLVVTYTPQIFRVVRVIRPHNELLERNRYILENGAGQQLATPNGKGVKEFYANDMSEADEFANEDAHVNMERALWLNKVERTNRDVAY